MENYGNNIRKFRNKRGYSQEFMSDKLGISQNAYSKIESGATKLKTETLEKIVRILGIDKSVIINDQHSKYSIEQNNHDTCTGVVIEPTTFDNEREVWRSLELSYQTAIQALKDALQSQKDAFHTQEILITYLRSQVEALQER